MNRNLRLEQLLPHPPKRVWQALTDPARLGEWFMENNFEPKLNHQFTFRMKPQRGWDGITHCEVIELEPLQRVAYTYRGKASGEKPLACAGINSRYADAALKGVFTELDTILCFSLTPERASDGTESTRLVMEHSGFKGFKLVIVSFVMGYGWGKVLRRLSAVLDGMANSSVVSLD
jgi:uncharacterized protein YndB with AHSA1/START domain